MTTIVPEDEAVFRAGWAGKPDAIRVLFVEDDKDFREALVDELMEHGFAVRGFADAASFLDAIDTTADADIVLLDWNLPETSGIDLLPQLRRRGVTLPVVFLTGRSLAANESLAFDRGAVDFIDKTRGVAILVRRLERAVKTGKPSATREAQKLEVHGRLTLRLHISRAYWAGVDVDLTVGEYNIVELLASNVGRSVTYRAIYDRMHYAGFIAGSGNDGYRANVRSAIKRIRNKFRELDPTFEAIENYTASGYCWGKPGVVG